jgi:hypothetical protein
MELPPEGAGMQTPFGRILQQTPELVKEVKP